MKLIKRTYYIFLNELRRLRKKPLPVVVATIAPIVVAFALIAIFSNPEIKEVPFVLVDYDNSSLSRMLTKSLDANGYLQLLEVVADEQISEEKFRNLDSYYTIIIPKDFSKKIKAGLGTEVKTQINGAMLIYAKLGNKAIAQTISTISSGINIVRLQGKGLTKKEAFDKAVPIQPQLHIIGNPYIDYRLYLIPGLLLSILQISASFSTLWVFRSDLESKGKIIPRYGNLLPFLLGRFTPIFIANLITVIIIFLVIFPLIGVHPNPSYFNLFLLTVLYVIVCMGIGLASTMIFKSVISAAQGLLVINSPAFVFSGYTFPVWGMPKIVQEFVNIIPVKHFFDGFFPMYVYGKTTELGIMPLLIIGAALYSTTIILIIVHNAIRSKEFDKIKVSGAVK